MNHFTLFETQNWKISHRMDSRYLGYLMVSSREEKSEISELSINALQELGGVLAQTEKLLTKAYAPKKVIFCKLGFSKGFSCHFHVIPIFDSILEEMKIALQLEEPDGTDAMFYINRTYCEKPLTLEEEGVIREELNQLRNKL